MKKHKYIYTMLALFFVPVLLFTIGCSACQSVTGSRTFGQSVPERSPASETVEQEIPDFSETRLLARLEEDDMQRSRIPWDAEAGIDNLEKRIWRGTGPRHFTDSRTSTVFSFNKAILFYDNEFIVVDGREMVIYGQYSIAANDIECSIIRRYEDEKYLDNQYYKEYYKLFFDNDTVTFTFFYNPALYYYPARLAARENGDIFVVPGEYQRAEGYYNIDGVRQSDILLKSPGSDTVADGWSNTYSLRIYVYAGGIKKTAASLYMQGWPLKDAETVHLLINQGEHIQITGRTLFKETVNGIEDCWYLITDLSHYIRYEGFVFGGYLTEQDEDWEYRPW